MQQGQSSDIGGQPAAKRAKIVPQGMMLTNTTDYQVLDIICDCQFNKTTT
jgi:hypothetical protein